MAAQRTILAVDSPEQIELQARNLPECPPAAGEIDLSDLCLILRRACAIWRNA
jgi:hypothetical protein